MKLKIKKVSPSNLSNNIVAIVFDDFSKRLTLLEKNLKHNFSRLLKSNNFKGEFMEKASFNILNNNSHVSVTFIGLGKRKEVNQEKTFKCFSSITYSRIKEKSNVKELSIVYPDLLDKDLFEISVEGLNNGFYSYDKYKSKKDNLSPLSLSLIVEDFSTLAVTKIVNNSSNLYLGVNLTRNLINEPPQTLTPKVLASNAMRISKAKNITCKVFDKKEIIKRKMFGIWDVGKGSVNEPKFIHLKYKSYTSSSSKKIKKIALIGKGVTYDTGGLSLKPADYMLTMKMDMGGAGCVLGVFEALAKLQPKNIEVHGLIPSVENMPGPNAYKPDDIVKGLSGKTIEVINTDAEGRVILSDAIEYANRLKVDEMVDLATLTGACMIALGNFTAGLFSNNLKLKDKLLKASTSVGEKIWQLPLDEELRPDINSQVADVKNSASTRYGGATTAAMFLEFFVDKNIPWSHIDIAGPAYIEKNRGWCATGSTGFGVRTLVNYLYLS